MKKGTIPMALGLLLIAAALTLTVYNIYDENRASRSVNLVLQEIQKSAAAAEAEKPSGHSPSEIGYDTETIPDYVRFPDMEMPESEIDGNNYIGVIDIPCLGLSLPIISDWSYPNLKIAPCRYKGSAYQDNLIIAGHNYQSHFKSIKQISPGAAVRFTDSNGNIFDYRVEYLETMDKTQVDQMEAGEWDLTLFTCTYGGQSRCAVRCRRVRNTAFLHFSSINFINSEFQLKFQEERNNDSLL